MKINVKYTAIIAAALIIGAFTIGTIGYKQDIKAISKRSSVLVDCSRYYASDYTSIHHLISDLNTDNFSDNYKTWGTVTSIYNNEQTMIIQSTDKFGNNAAIAVYFTNTEGVAVGNVVSVSFAKSSLTLENNIPTITDGTVTLDYLSNANPVESIATSSNYIEASKIVTSEEYLSVINRGPRLVHVKNVDFIEFDFKDNSISASFKDGTMFKIFFDNSNIPLLEKAEFYAGKNLDVSGFLSVANEEVVLFVTSIDALVHNPEPVADKTLSFTTSNLRPSGSYESNYKMVTALGIQFGFSRYKRSGPSGSMTTLNAFPVYKGVQSEAGHIRNATGISNISSIEIEYSTDEMSDNNLIIEHGQTRLLDKKTTFNTSTAKTTALIPLNGSNFFKILTSDVNLTIYSFTVNYKDDSFVDSSYYSLGEGETRLNPLQVEESDLYEGFSVNVPVKIDIVDNDYYNVIETKTYTYYSQSHVLSNPELAANAAMITPFDVANYFNVFKKIPANYGIRDDGKNKDGIEDTTKYGSVRDIFNEDARVIQSFSRDDGYAQSVPYRPHEGSSLPMYYELDIAHDASYSGSSRGAARVVSWIDGFNAEGYDLSPVSLYTDDHYETWFEYYNDGTFSNRFNAEEWIAATYNYSPAKTLIER